MYDPTNSRYRYLPLRIESTYRRYFDSKTENTALGNDSHDIPSHGSYGALLFTPQWRNRREQILLRDHSKCVICTSSENLQIHHRQYHFLVRQSQFRLPWEYADHLLITLCESCHGRGHSKYKVPTINI
jgi:5-methylcytosine-specific restriction endonuclease McrA